MASTTKSESVTTAAPETAMTFEDAIARFKATWDEQSQAIAKTQPIVAPALTTQWMTTAIKRVAAREFDGDVWIAHGMLVHAGLPVLLSDLGKVVPFKHVHDGRARLPGASVPRMTIDTTRYVALRACHQPKGFVFRPLFAEDTVKLEEVSQEFRLPLDIVVYLATVRGLLLAARVLSRVSVLEAFVEMDLLVEQIEEGILSEASMEVGAVTQSHE